MVRFRNRKQIKAIGLIFTALMFVILLFFHVAMSSRGIRMNLYDFKILDIFYKIAVEHGFGPPTSFTPGIVYLNITDQTYNFFDKNYLDRADMANLNNALSHMDTEAVIYDIIFARRSRYSSDSAFSKSLESLSNVYLPTGLIVSDKPSPFNWQDGASYERLRSDYLGNPDEKRTDDKRYSPFHAVTALMQQSDFAIKAEGSGDISATADSDGIYRHIIMLVKIDNKYFPTLALALFLDWAGISLNEISVEWGENITIPASKSSTLKNDVIIPIDWHGRAFIPFAQTMGKEFSHISVHTFISSSEDEGLMGNLLEKFEGNFVFISDIALGTSDLGYTPLQKDAPLVITHVALLNALLTNTFYSEWPLDKTVLLLCLLLTVMACASTLRSSWLMYVAGITMIISVPLLTWFEFTAFRLFPVVTVLSFLLLIFFSFIITLESSGAKERAFIRNTFARYVPEKVVNTLLAQPEMVTLGGEERVITVLFSDIANFTTISESLSPSTVVDLLNKYLTEMTEIIMQNGGIIDKFQGDSIMAEFGVPIPVKDHADQAVTAALQMLKRLSELREEWRSENRPLSDGESLSARQRWWEIYCRIGINTNNMIVGNMGSKSVLDYTVIGDAVNLASRLEGANKLYGTSLMISEFTHKLLTPGRFKTRILDYVRVKGKSEPVRVYEVYGEIDTGYGESLKNSQQQINYNEYTPEDDHKSQEERYYTKYQQGFEAYMAQNFTQASTLFRDALKLRPEDIACIRMVERIDKIDQTLHPDSRWDGAISLMTK